MYLCIYTQTSYMCIYIYIYTYRQPTTSSEEEAIKQKGKALDSGGASERKTYNYYYHKYY